MRNETKKLFEQFKSENSGVKSGIKMKAIAQWATGKHPKPSSLALTFSKHMAKIGPGLYSIDPLAEAAVKSKAPNKPKAPKKSNAEDTIRNAMNKIAEKYSEAAGYIFDRYQEEKAYEEKESYREWVEKNMEGAKLNFSPFTIIFPESVEDGYQITLKPSASNVAVSAFK